MMGMCDGVKGVDGVKGQPGLEQRGRGISWQNLGWVMSAAGAHLVPG